MDIQSFKKSDIKRMIQSTLEYSDKVNKVIEPFLSLTLNQQQKLELCQVGKFIANLGENAFIISKCESPDFVISHNGISYGLEHVSIVNDKLSPKFNSIKSLFQDAEDVFRKRYPGNNLLANIYLKSNDFSFKKVDADNLKSQISDFMYNRYILKNEVSTPDFIESVSISPHSRVAFVYNPGAHYVEQINTTSIIKLIEKKEAKINEYIKNSGIDKQWLLMMIGTVDLDSYDFGDMPLEMDVVSDFNRIFIMEDYSSRIIEIKTKKDCC